MSKDVSSMVTLLRLQLAQSNKLNVRIAGVDLGWCLCTNPRPSCLVFGLWPRSPPACQGIDRTTLNNLTKEVPK